MKDKFTKAPKLDQKVEGSKEQLEVLKKQYKQLKIVLEAAKSKIEKVLSEEYLDKKDIIWKLAIRDISPEALKMLKIANADDLIKHISPSLYKYLKYKALFANNINPEDFFPEINKFKKEFWAKKFLERLAKKNPKLVAKGVGYYKDMPWAKEVLLQAVRYERVSAYAAINEYKDMPWAKDVILESNLGVIDFADKLIDKPWFGDLVKKHLSENDISKVEVSIALAKFNAYAGMSWSKDILEKILNRGESGGVVEAAKLLVLVTDHGEIPHLKESMKKIVKKYSRFTINKLTPFPAELSYANELFDILLDHDVYGCLDGTMFTYRHLPWFEKSIRGIVSKIDKTNASKVFKELVLRGDYLPWMPEVLSSIAAKFKKAAFDNYYFYYHMPWADDLLLKAAGEEDREKAIRMIENYENSSKSFLDTINDLKHSYNDAIVIKQLKRELAMPPYAKAFVYFEKYKDYLTFPEELLEESVKRIPHLAFTYLYKYKNEKWAFDLLDLASSLDSNQPFVHIDKLIEMGDDKVVKLFKYSLKSKLDNYLAINYYPKYRQLRGADDILFGATKLNPEMLLNYADRLGNIPDKVLNYAISKNPVKFFQNYDKIKHNNPDLARKGAEFALRVLDNKEIKDYKEFLRLNFLLNCTKDQDVKAKLDKIVAQKKTTYGEMLKKYGALDSLIQDNIQKAWGDSDDRRFKLAEDPLLAGVFKIEDKWISGSEIKNDYDLKQYKVMIARNLAYKNIPINEKNVKEEYERIKSLRKQHESMPLFKGRSVVLLAHIEKFEDGSDRFGKKATIEAIRAQGGNISDDNILKPKDTIASLKATKKKFLDQIVNGKPPLTVMFDGHGGKKGLYITDGQVESGIVQDSENYGKITPDELAKALKMREEKLKKDPKLYEKERKSPLVIIYNSCLSSDYLRNVIKKSKGTKNKYIHVGVSEYGMYGYSNPKSKFGSDFTEKTLNLKDKKHITTLGTVIKNEKKAESNPSIYISSGEGDTQQFAKHDIAKKDKLDA